MENKIEEITVSDLLKNESLMKKVAESVNLTSPQFIPGDKLSFNLTGLNKIVSDDECAKMYMKNKKIKKLLKINNQFRPYRISERNADNNTRIINWIKTALKYGVTGKNSPKLLAHIVKSSQLYFNRETGCYARSGITSQDAKSLYSNAIMHKAFTPRDYRLIRDMNWDGIPVKTQLMINIPKILSIILGVKVKQMDALQWEILREYVNKIEQSIISYSATLNPMVFEHFESEDLLRKDINPRFYIASGLFAVYRFANSQHFALLRDVMRGVKRHRSLYRQYLEEIDSSRLTSKKAVVEKLFTFSPKSWEHNHNVPQICKSLAKRDYPNGSLVSVELEFVGNIKSPLVGVPNNNSVPCMDCDACHHNEELSENEYPLDCESPVNLAGVEWLKHPLITFVTDGSVGANSSEQITLKHQEAKCIQTIGKYDELKMLCDWMNVNKLEVNKSCGLHCHLDTRDLDDRKYKKATRRGTNAVKNWLQFCVPFSRFEGTFCRAYSETRYDRYKAVNPLARDKHNTLEFRLGSASTNYEKITKWIDLCHYIIRGKGKLETINGFLESDASPELKAFVIARICRFYKSHEDGRKVSPDAYGIYNNPNHPANKIPDDITKIVKIWGTVGLNEFGS